MAQFRPKLNPILHNLRGSVTEELKRSNHPDFATTGELKAREWSGVRKNSISDNYEFWISGSVVKTISAVLVQNDYSLLEKAHVDLFGISIRRT